MYSKKLIGFIFFLFSLFPLNYAFVLAGSPSFWLWAQILFFLFVFDMFWQIAWMFFFGMKDNDVKE
jgi:hypothetical protein